MNEIILGLVKRKKVLTVKEIVDKTGFKREEIIRSLKFLSLKGKISYVEAIERFNSSCKGCILNKICKLKGGEDGIRINRKP